MGQCCVKERKEEKSYFYSDPSVVEFENVPLYEGRDKENKEERRYRIREKFFTYS